MSNSLTDEFDLRVTCNKSRYWVWISVQIYIRDSQASAVRDWFNVLEVYGDPS